MGTGMAIRIGFMSERVPQLVANRNDGFVSPVAVVAANARERACISAVERSTEQRPRSIGQAPVPLLAAHHDADANRLEGLELSDQARRRSRRSQEQLRRGPR